MKPCHWNLYKLKKKIMTEGNVKEHPGTIGHCKNGNICIKKPGKEGWEGVRNVEGRKEGRGTENISSN